MAMGDVNDIMPGSDRLGFLVILKKSCELRFGLRLDFWTWVRPVQLWTAGYTCALVESWRWMNNQHVENLNLKKVIKVSYLNQKKVVSVSRVFSDSYAYKHSILWTLWTFYTFVCFTNSHFEYVTHAWSLNLLTMMLQSTMSWRLPPPRG